MNTWIISDTHFNHTKLEEWGGRSGDWQNMLERGLESIPAGDTLIHLGDICIGNDAEVHERIMGKKEGIDFMAGALNIAVKRILVRGNHDKKSRDWYTEHGWDFVCDQIGLVHHGVDLLLSHRPMPPDTWRWRYNIHGHTHGNNHRAEEYNAWLDPVNFHIDMSPEVAGYAPVRLDTLMKKYKV